MISYEPRDWKRLLLRYQGTVLPCVLSRTLAVTALAVVVTVVHTIGPPMAIPATAHAMVGVALGLLLVFRTNASYDRYWEGRKLLDGMVSDTRNLARYAYAYLPVSSRDKLVRFSRLLLHVCIQNLRREPLKESIKTELSERSASELDASSAPSLLVAGWMSRALAEEAECGRLSEQRLIAFEQTMSHLVAQFGGAERIRDTPVPFAYAHHIKCFLTIFCFTTPFALLEATGLYTPVAAAVVAYALFGIDEIGIEIEEPFGDDANDLPLDAIDRELRQEIAELFLDGPAGSTTSETGVSMHRSYDAVS